MSAPEPSGRYAAAAILLALERAGIAEEELGYICAHGTGTSANDLAETRAIRLALGAAADRVPISSPKSMVGHLIGAAGALSVMVCLLAMRDGVIPPTINLETPDPGCDLDYVPATSPASVRSNGGSRTRSASAGQNCVVAVRAP